MRTSSRAVALSIALAVLGASPVHAQSASPSGAAIAIDEKLPADAKAFLRSLHPQSGDVRIAAAKAVLHLGDRYYFLPADEAKRVLIQLWGNPPEVVSDVLGLVMEKGKSPIDDAWGAVITYRDTGYVSDADATAQDYDAVLASMKEGEATENEQRKAAGFPTLSVVGWAQPPSYDATAHSLIWARELASSDSKINSLNYDVRLLGRTGVLSLNMVATMPMLAQVRQAAKTFGQSADFETGARYADYDATTDKVAGYGLAGLVGGGAAVAVAKKVGFLAVLAKFWKLILVGILAFGGAALAMFRKLFGRRAEDEEEG
ncbi:DUF2167 domain-containing protein [Sphingomonas sp. BT-65]|uniref:DUF2167 domain-containing protein n=1 Tax=Sphingomonas sp. BT-65 TaxID=2989821 RepID=UPI0022358F41|nr:DUF2167 domain-containing protein [Sphingomonas sp. BT-65]MCW4463244.1 DUF2167 domain-containing protein [Sphingomonas sp. BT-65]